MLLENLSKNMLIAIVIYIFSLIYGVNFVLLGFSFGLFGLSLLLITLMVVLPGIFFVLYFIRGHIELLYGKERILRILAYASTLVCTAFVLFVIVPISY